MTVMMVSWPRRRLDENTSSSTRDHHAGAHRAEQDVDPGGVGDADAGERAVRHRVAEVGHPAQHDPGADDGRDDADDDRGEEGALHELGLERVSQPVHGLMPAVGRSEGARRARRPESTVGRCAVAAQRAVDRQAAREPAAGEREVVGGDQQRGAVVGEASRTRRAARAWLGWSTPLSASSSSTTDASWARARAR